MMKSLFLALMLMGSLSWGAANTATSTWTPTWSPTASPTHTPTATPTCIYDGVCLSLTPTLTNTPTDSPTATPTASPTKTITSTSTATPTASPTRTRTPNYATATPSRTMTVTKTATRTVFVSFTPTISATITPTNTPTNTPQNTATLTPQVTATPKAEFQLLWNHVELNGVNIPVQYASITFTATGAAANGVIVVAAVPGKKIVVTGWGVSTTTAGRITIHHQAGAAVRSNSASNIFGGGLFADNGGQRADTLTWMPGLDVNQPVCADFSAAMTGVELYVQYVLK